MENSNDEQAELLGHRSSPVLVETANAPGYEAPAPGTRRSERFRLTLTVCAGLYTWSVSVLPLLNHRELLTWPTLCGICAVLALLSAPLLPSRRLALCFVLHVFLAGCLLCWWGTAQRSTAHSWSSYAALGWIVYTLALGSLTTPAPTVRAVASQLRTFRPRVRPSKSAALSLGFGLVSTVGLSVYSFQVEGPQLAMLAHLGSLAVGLILLQQSVLLAEYFQQKAKFRPHGSSIWWLSVALVLLVTGGLVSGWATAVG